MGTTQQEISEWFDRGVADGATHMIVACDTFDHEDYPVYVEPGEDARECADKINGSSMQRVMEVYCLALDKAAQLAEHRAFHYDAVYVLGDKQPEPALLNPDPLPAVPSAVTLSEDVRRREKELQKAGEPAVDLSRGYVRMLHALLDVLDERESYVTQLLDVFVKENNRMQDDEKPKSHDMTLDEAVARLRGLAEPKMTGRPTVDARDRRALKMVLDALAKGEKQC